MDFQYKGIDSEGSRHQGSITALDNADAQTKLQVEGIHVIELIELSNKKSLKDYFQRGISLDELEFFTSQLSLLLESGVRVDKGIEIIQQTNSQPALNKLLFKISASLKKGSS